MQSKGNAPTAAQKRWREAVRELGSVISGGPAVIHHPVGCSGKHNKVDIGHWWVIPLTDEEHKALHNGEFTYFGFHTWGTRSDRPGWYCELCGVEKGTEIQPLCIYHETQTRKQFEKQAFEWVLNHEQFDDSAMTPEVYHAIMDYHK